MVRLSFVLVLWCFTPSVPVWSVEPFEDALRATVRITKSSTSGTGFFVEVSESDGSKKHYLVSAAHVFENMDAEKCTLIFRAIGKDKEFVRKEVDLVIRDGKKALWVRHSQLDVAVIGVALPEGIDLKPFPLQQIADEQFAMDRKIRVGQEVCIPCFPAQLEANAAGWPILRKGSIASHPLTPLSSAKTMFVDYSHFAGDSGSPVVTWDDKQSYVVGLVFAMQRQSDKTKSPFEERIVHTPLGLAVTVQSPIIRKVIDDYRKVK